MSCQDVCDPQTTASLSGYVQRGDIDACDPQDTRMALIEQRVRLNSDALLRAADTIERLRKRVDRYDQMRIRVEYLEAQLSAIRAAAAPPADDP